MYYIHTYILATYITCTNTHVNVTKHRTASMVHRSLIFNIITSFLSFAHLITRIPPPHPTPHRL